MTLAQGIVIICANGPVNTLRPRQNNRHFADIFKLIFVDENVCILIPLTFVSNGPVNNMPTLIHVMAWRRTCDKLLAEPMMALFIDAFMRHPASLSEPQYRAYRLVVIATAAILAPLHYCKVTATNLKLGIFA